MLNVVISKVDVLNWSNFEPIGTGCMRTGCIGTKCIENECVGIECIRPDESGL
jgi:hypothetical protein